MAVTHPTWKVVLHPESHPQDITASLTKRLVNLSITCEQGGTADQLDITLSDTAADLAIPPTGALLGIHLGATPDTLALIGTFTVDELEYSSAPRKLHITGRAADVSAAWQEKKERSFDDVTLGDIAQVLAQEHGLQLGISKKLASISLGHIDQTNESDLNLISRLANAHGGNATVKAGHLLVLENAKSQSASGQPLASIHIDHTQASQWRWETKDRSQYTGVVARWHSQADAKQHSVTLGKPGCLLTLSTIYPNKDDAAQAAKAKLTQITQAKGSVSINLPQGDTTRLVAAPCTLSGFHPVIDGANWQVKKVTHKLGNAGYGQTVELFSEIASK